MLSFLKLNDTVPFADAGMSSVTLVFGTIDWMNEPYSTEPVPLFVIVRGAPPDVNETWKVLVLAFTT